MADQASPGGSVGRSSSQHCRLNPSLSQHPGRPAHFISNSNVTPARAPLDDEPQVYSETDYLLPSQLYRGSSSSGSTGAKDPSVPRLRAESVYSMVLQILVPFLLAGLGTVSAGILLGVVQVREWREATENIQVDETFTWPTMWAHWFPSRNPIFENKNKGWLIIIFSHYVYFHGRARMCSRKSQRSLFCSLPYWGWRGTWRWLWPPDSQLLWVCEHVHANKKLSWSMNRTNWLTEASAVTFWPLRHKLWM